MLIKESFQNELILSEQDKQTGFWVQDDVHLAHALTPLFASFMVPAVTEGTKAAFANMKMPLTQFRFKLADSRVYQQNVPFPGDVEERLEAHKEAVKPLLPVLKQRLQRIVDEELLPFYHRLDAYCSMKFDAAETAEKIKELHDFYKKAWQLHFEIVMPRTGFMALEQLYAQLTGETDTAVIYDLLSGVMNKSLETDRELWLLAGLAKQSREVAACFAEADGSGYRERLAACAEGAAFLEKLQGVLDVYGYRCTNSHEFSDETWVENPEQALRIIASYMGKDYDFDSEFAQTIQERKARTAEVYAKMPEGELKQTFVMMHEWALDCWGLDEDHHFYIDAMLPAKSRLFLLSVGEALVEQGVFSSREDICYLYLDELLEAIASPSSLQSIVDQRKAEHEENKRKQVPPFYGTPPQGGLDPALERIFGGKPPEIEEKEMTFKGYAASQGIYTGTVKVVRGPEDFVKVKQGDVLVCKTTTPPWTVLFSVAGAIVTDAGGILSHAGTVAREYKLPAVVGCKVATTVLQDGDKVTVDGTQGVVHFGER